MKLLEQVVYAWCKAQVRNSLRSDEQSCAVLSNCKELLDSRMVWNSWRDLPSQKVRLLFYDQDAIVPLWSQFRSVTDPAFAWSFDTCSSANLRFQSHTSLWDFQLWHNERQDWCCFHYCQKPHENSCPPRPPYYQTLSETRYIRGGEKVLCEAAMIKIFFSNLLLVPIMNEDWRWLFFYRLKKGMMGETHREKDVRFLQRCSDMIDSYCWASESYSKSIQRIGRAFQISDIIKVTNVCYCFFNMKNPQVVRSPQTPVFFAELPLL